MKIKKLTKWKKRANVDCGEGGDGMESKVGQTIRESETLHDSLGSNIQTNVLRTKQLFSKIYVKYFENFEFVFLFKDQYRNQEF